MRGAGQSLGADCIEKEMRPEHPADVQAVLERAESTAKPSDFKRYGSARKLYHFDVDHAGDY